MISPLAGAARNTPGGGVRLLEITPLLEVGHDVADRRRRDPVLHMPRHRTGADGLAHEDEGLDDIAQDLAIARSQFDGWADGSHRYFWAVVPEPCYLSCVA